MVGKQICPRVVYLLLTPIAMKRKTIACLVPAFICLIACNHPKPISNNITKTTVAINGKKDSVINNPEKNYGNATVSEPCVKCLLQTVQSTSSYKKLTKEVSQQRIIYDVNWITSSKPKAIGNGDKIINGMEIDVNEKAGNSSKKVASYLYNNQNAQFYLLNPQNKYNLDEKVSDAALKMIRRSCFWGVGSAK